MNSCMRQNRQGAFGSRGKTPAQRATSVSNAAGGLAFPLSPASEVKNEKSN
jgi:hypothetical protein